MTESFLVPVLLGTPPVKDHTALGLAEQVKCVVTGAGVVDGQVQGGGVDGQYILMGVWDKLLDLLELGEEGMALEKLRQWVTVIWEPAHNINLADGDVRNLVIFDWLVRLTSCVGDVTATLVIGNGLEQCFEEAEESGQKFWSERVRAPSASFRHDGTTIIIDFFSSFFFFLSFFPPPSLFFQKGLS